MQALILVGGLGTRLREVVNDRPKPMALVNGRPFLEYQIEFLKKNGVNDIIFSTGYLGEKIEEYFGSGEKHGVSIRYAKEKDLLGTGGAIKNAKDLLDGQFFVLNGDSIFLVDIQSMVNFHKRNNGDITLALTKVKENSRYGSVHINDNFQIMQFVEKGNSSGNLISGGMYLIEKNLFDWDLLPDKFSLENDVFTKIVVKKRVFGFVSNSYFIDIGTVEDYQRFGNELASGLVNI